MKYYDETLSIIKNEYYYLGKKRVYLDYSSKEGWVAEDTLAIAIYSVIRYQDDFSKAVIAAVNHDGDSDSTGSVTGNIVGAWLGFDAICQSIVHMKMTLGKQSILENYNLQN